MTRALLLQYRWPLALFGLVQVVIMFLPASPTTTNWAIVWAYAVIAALAIAARAPLAAVTALSVCVVRTLLALGITGLSFRVASATFAVLFFVLVLYEIEHRRLYQNLPS